MNLAKCISHRIREILFSKHITQYKLEMLSGISHGTMNSLLNCRYNAANIKTVFIIIQALNMSVLEFFDSPLFADLYNIDLD